ncbi:tRNA 2-thiouridine(34) synthase MnmA [Bacteroidota bacterium]
MELNRNRVLVGMSGGVDSSAAAGLLLEKGYEVTGVTIEPFYFYDYYKHLTQHNPKGSIDDAKEVCDKLGIQHLVVDYFDYFKKNVVDYFINEYLEGRTPNPCVKCNPIIKWGKLIQTADEEGAKYISTGHYAIVEHDEGLERYILKKGKDFLKDQSYFLWGLSQKQLARTIFPLGKIAKPGTRKHAERMGLRIHDKSESQEVCFIPDNDYHNFLRQAIPDIDEKIGPGDILFNGRVVGKHKGYPYYTIGQRKGIGVTYKDALYVKKINPDNNTIEVDINEAILSNSLVAHSVNLIKYDKLNHPGKFMAKIRYRDKGSEAFCSILEDGRLKVDFAGSKRAITPGQSVVMYEGNDLVGGGIIE